MITKRIFDIIFSFVIIIVSFPLWIVIIIAIKLDTKGSIFYKSERVGKYGRYFYLYKFRSMVENADQIGGKINGQSDPRQTRVGRFIRKWKIDELPNLLNVLKGEMSIVGPRPEAPEYVQHYKPGQMAVLNVKPGITDMAISGKYRNEQQILDQVKNPHSYYIDVILQESLSLNLEYVRLKPSLLLDLKIILKTLGAIFFEHKVNFNIIR